MGTLLLDMFSIQNRNYCEQALAKALSRHIGYTTGAYSIFRMANIVLAFKGEPSKYQFQLIEELKNRGLQSSGSIQEDYASEIPNFAVALGLLERIQGQGPPRLSRFKLSPAGLAYRAACELNLEPFKRFLLSRLAVDSDADTYVLLLEVLLALQDKPNYSDYRSIFKDWTIEIRERRCAWINLAFSSSMIRERLVEKIRWTKLNRAKEVIQKDEVKDNFVRHHASPRKGWAIELAHYNGKENRLTPDGIELVNRLRGSRNRFFWIGPPEGCQEILRVPPEHLLEGPFAPSWSILRPMKTGEDWEVIEKIAEMIASFMECAFPHLRMVHANQAPLDAIKLYIYYKESEFGIRLDTDALLRDILLKHSDKFAALSKRSGPLGYYQLRSQAKK